MKKLLWIIVGMLVLVHTHAFSTTLNFNDSASLPDLKMSRTCGTWNNEWSFSGSEFFCNAPVTFASGVIIRTTSPAVTIRANTGITLNNNSVGTSSNRVNLATNSDAMQISGAVTIFGNVINGSGAATIQGTSNTNRMTINGQVTSAGSLSMSSVNITGALQAGSGAASLTNVNLTGNLQSSGNITLSNGDITGSLTTTGTLDASNGSSVTAAVSANNGITSNGTVFGSSVSTSNGGLNITAGSVAGTVSSSNVMVASGVIFSSGVSVTNGTLTTSNSTYNANVSVSSTITSNGDSFNGTLTSTSGNLNLTGGYVTGLVSTPCCTLTTNNTNLFAGATVHSGLSITGGTLNGPFTLTSTNSASFTDTDMDSGSITGANTITISGSTIAAATISSNNQITITNSTVGTPDSPVAMSSTYGEINLTNSVAYGALTAGPYEEVNVSGDGGVVGTCVPAYNPSTACGASLPPSPDPYWNFNENSWTGASAEVLDSSVNLLHGTAKNNATTSNISPAIPTTNGLGTCEYGEFVGQNSGNGSRYVQIPNNTVINNATTFSVSFWINIAAGSQPNTTFQTLVAYGGSTFNNTGRFELFRNTAGNLAYEVRMQDNEIYRIFTAGGAVFNGSWQHITATYNRSSRIMRLYVNGSEVASKNNIGNSGSNDTNNPRAVTGNMAIGALPSGSNGITGKIDEVRFFPKELSVSEVKALMVKSSACTSSEPILSWNLNVASWNGAAGEVLDTSGNSLNGTTYNSLLSSITVPALKDDPGTCSFSQFNGTNQYIAVADNAKLDITNELTVSIWVRPRAYPSSGYMTILSKDTNYEFHVTPAGKIFWWWRDEDNATRELLSNASVPLNQWSHVAITYKNGAQRIYINGTADTSTGSFTKKLATNNLALEVGRDNVSNRYFNGDLDEVRIYARAQSQAKIQEIRDERANCSVVANCLLTEQFNDYTQWYRTVLSGTAPEVINGRLQLTNNNQNQSTAITFKQGFPTAGNKLTIEFDHFAYGGTGADGIGLVLSDALVTPKPGSFGGSLGYAQRTNFPVQSGFAGGWMGIGFDEFGNYAKKTEGRDGGVADNIDRSQAIGVRGAGSGTTGYVWLGGTPKQTSRPLSVSGSTPLGWGDRFKITLDTATNASQVGFSLQRSTDGGSTFTELLSSSDVSLATQPAMPTNFLLSFTGSTGGSTNFHAIDNVQVCSFKAPIPVPIGEPSIHHFELSYDSSGLTCASSNVTVKACANQACTSLYTGEVTVDLGADNGASWVGGSSVTFTGGQVTKALTKTATGATVLSVSSSSVGAANNPVCYEGGSLDTACSLNFLDTGLRFSSIPNQVAGLASPSQVQLQVVQTNTQTGACVARVTPTSTVQFGYQCVDPVSCITEQTFKIDSSSIASNPASSVTQYTDVTRSFDSNAATNFNISYSDVGKVKLYARLVLQAQGTQPAITLEQQSNEFIVRPDRIVVSAVTSSAGTTNPGGTSTGAGFVAAGEEFKIVLDVVNRVGDLTPNFGRETTAEAVSISSSLAYPILSGVPCAVGTANCISAPSVSFNNPAFTAVSGVGGRFENTTAKWLQVGSLNINGKLEDQNYLGSGDTASTNLSVVVGRFYPHHFALISATLDDGCVAGNFSYMDSASISSNVRVQAMAVDGSTVLTNYNAGNNKAYAGVAAVSLVAENANNGQNLASRLETTLPSWVDGSWLWQATNTDFTKRTDRVPDGPYSALQLGLAITSEKDNRTFNVLTMNPATNTDCVASATCNSAQVGSTLDIRYGRFMLQNAAGPEEQNLPISLQSQYWNGNVFTQNLQDSCSSFDPNSLAVSGVTTLKGGTAGPMVAGQNPFNSIFIPAPNTTGVATLQYQIPLQLQYMQFPWNGGTSLADPTAEANFGRFRGNKRQIFWQERLN